MRNVSFIEALWMAIGLYSLSVRAWLLREALLDIKSLVKSRTNGAALTEAANNRFRAAMLLLPSVAIVAIGVPSLFMAEPVPAHPPTKEEIEAWLLFVFSMFAISFFFAVDATAEMKARLQIIRGRRSSS